MNIRATSLPRRILLVAPQPFYLERGTPIAVRLLIETLCAEGYRVDLLAYHEGQDVAVPGMRIHRIPRIPGVRDVPIGISWKKLVCDVFLCAKLLQLIVRERYDAIHAVEEAVFPAAVLRLLGRSRLVYDMDSALSDQLIEKWKMFQPLARALGVIEWAAIRRSDAVFAVCEDLACRIALNAPSVPVFVIEDAALPPRSHAEEVEPLRKQLGVNGLLALYVGNLERYQGVDLMIEAMRELPPELYVTMVVIGGAAPDLERARALVKRLHIDQRVRFLGPRPVDRLAHYLEQADILLSPRRLGENTPMKVYSYMQAGKAVLATRIRSHTQVLDEACALLVDPSATGLARGLAALCNDAELRSRLGAAARARAEERHSLESFKTKVRAAYRSIFAVGEAA